MNTPPETCSSMIDGEDISTDNIVITTAAVRKLVLPPTLDTDFLLVDFRKKLQVIRQEVVSLVRPRRRWRIVSRRSHTRARSSSTYRRRSPAREAAHPACPRAIVLGYCHVLTVIGLHTHFNIIVVSIADGEFSV